MNVSILHHLSTINHGATNSNVAQAASSLRSTPSKSAIITITSCSAVTPLSTVVQYPGLSHGEIGHLGNTIRPPPLQSMNVALLAGVLQFRLIVQISAHQDVVPPRVKENSSAGLFTGWTARPSGGYTARERGRFGCSYHACPSCWTIDEVSSRRP